MTRPIRLKTHSVLIKAPRDMVYEKMTSFRGGRLQGDNNESSRVISQDGNDIVAEFKTKAGPFTYTTLEEVKLEPPDRITFRHVKGPLHYAREEFVLNDVDGDTELVHSGEFIWNRFPVLGWLGGWFYTKRTFERAIEKHVQQIKASCDALAARSHVLRKRRAAKSD